MRATIGAHVLRDLNLEGLVEAFGLATETGKATLQARLSAPLTDTTELQGRQAVLRDIRKRLRDGTQRSSILAERAKLREAEEDVKTVATAASDERHAEYYNQILWKTDSPVARLNEYGLLNEAIVFVRTLMIPGLAILMPIFVFLMPVFVYAFILKKPLDFTEYFKLLSEALKKAMPSMLGKPRFAGKGGFLESGEQMLHIGVGVAVFVASIWNQISAATSMRKVVADMRKRAESVRVMVGAVTALESALGLPSIVKGTAWSDSTLGLFGQAWNSPTKVDALLARAGELDMLVGLASTKKTSFAKYSSGFKVTDLWHPGTGSARVPNSVDFSGSKKRHVLLTGPNRGGKSTLLKSLGAAVLMSQTVGLTFAKTCVTPVFQNIITALAPTDTLGKLSLFEAEIEFAKEVNARLATSTGPTFLMMDEIFHGTNAHDGVEASQVFLDGLYASTKPVVSVVSTHYMDLPNRYGSNKDTQVQNLCMEASKDPVDPDRLIYTYRLKNGVNKFSSVREILRERGLLLCGSDTKKTS